MKSLLRLLAMLGLAVLVVLAPRWWERTGSTAERHCSVGRTADLIAVDPPALRTATVDMAPAFRDVLVNRHELRPDRRFLFALLFADCLLTGQQPTELAGAYERGTWSLTYRGRDAGSLPALPDFGDALSLLSRRVEDADAGSTLELTGSVDGAELDALLAAVDGMQPAEVAGALERIDELWRGGAGDPRLLEAAARGLVYLTLLGDDPLELTDPVAGRALATLAIARELAGSDLRREEALLALKMGYAAHAHDVATGLPDDDPARLYVLGNDEELRRLAETSTADGLTRQLGTRGLLADTPAEEASSGGDPSLPPFLPPGFRVALYVADILTEQHGLDPAGSAAAFERDVRRRTSGLAGPFLDSDTYASYLAGAFYTEVYREATRRLERGSVARDTYIGRRLARADVAVAEELSTWFANLGSREPLELEVDLSRLGTLPPRALERSLDALVSALGGNDPRRQISAARVLAEHMDSRVDHLFVYGSLAGHRFYDPIARERAYRRIVALAGPQQPRMLAWMAMYDGDGDALERMALDPEASVAQRAYALGLAAREGLIPDARVRNAARALIDAAPSDWDVRSVFVDYLERTGDLDTALVVVVDWLENSGEPGRFPPILARSTMARLLQAAGDLDGALEWIDQVAGSGQNGAIGRAALIRAHRGEAEGMILAQRAVDRYPSSAWSRSVLAEVYWTLGRPNAAANFVRDAQPVLGAFDWREEIGRALASAFEDRPVEEAVTAMRALRGTGIPPFRLLQVALGLRNHGRPDLAFELTSGFAPPGLEGLLWITNAYGYLVEAEGEARARAWYLEALPPGTADAASMFMFSEGHPHLLWDAIPDPSALSDPAWVWLMRAAAFVQSGDDSGRGRTLMTHFAVEDPNPYHRIGRYLMGLDDEAQVLSLVTRGDRLAEVAYYVGLKAEAEGRLEDAIAWYHVVLDTGLMQEGEYRWALDRLWSWSSRTRSVGLLGGAD